ncbi:redoxin domain-containing protein [Candidatus Palauibacter sp.]|uniref:redoxin domain-containing protein n=1 Tax=Candidatus Palauibacter sp. TaxID=3101350 RepID=UPI003AF2A19C
MKMSVGDRVEPFTLPYEAGQTIDLADHLGRERIVLLFFPFAFTSVCTAEFCRIRDDWSAFDALHAVVLGISVDSPFVTSRFRAAENIPFPILSDFNRTVTGEWGVLYDDFHGFHGVAKRAAFVIGTDGKVAYTWVTEDAGVEPDYAELLNAVENAC